MRNCNTREDTSFIRDTFPQTDTLETSQPQTNEIIGQICEESE